jgi:E3 ubiquitin-protein ligase RNF13
MHFALMQLADPEDACTSLTFSEYEQPWVALISRSQKWRETNCTFDIKV